VYNWFLSVTAIFCLPSVNQTEIFITTDGHQCASV